MLRYCFICSAARSGSTLLDMLIGGHVQAASLGEFSFLGKALALDQDCSCGVKLSQCAAWSRLLDRIHRETGRDMRSDPYAFRQWDTRASTLIDHRLQTWSYLAGAKLRSLLCDLHYRLPPNSLIRPPLPANLVEGVQSTSYLLKAVAAEWNKDLVVDSSKNVHKALAMYEQSPDSVRVIFLTRDGRGVYYSRRGSGFSRVKSVQAWSRYNKRALSLLYRCVSPNHLLRLRYEDLVADPPGTLARICEFLNLPPDPAMLDLSAGERHLCNGNDARFVRAHGITEDDRWKAGLTGDELKYFQRYGRDLNAVLGYK